MTLSSMLNRIRPLKQLERILAAGYSFQVTDADTANPISGAQCSVNKGTSPDTEGCGCKTNSSGYCSCDPMTSVHYYTVYKAGYETVHGPIPSTMINVIMEPTVTAYWVSIMAGSKGGVEPSGTIQVPANSSLTITATPDPGYELDYWLIDGEEAGSRNPITVTINHDSFSVKAIFGSAPEEEECPFRLPFLCFLWRRWKGY